MAERRQSKYLLANDPPLSSRAAESYLGYGAGVGKTYQMLQEGIALWEKAWT